MDIGKLTTLDSPHVKVCSDRRTLPIELDSFASRPAKRQVPSCVHRFDEHVSRIADSMNSQKSTDGVAHAALFGRIFGKVLVRPVQQLVDNPEGVLRIYSVMRLFVRRDRQRMGDIYALHVIAPVFKQSLVGATVTEDEAYV